MAQYRITNRISGQDLGTYEAETEDDALEALARDAGYASYAESLEVSGGSRDELTVKVLHRYYGGRVEVYEDGHPGDTVESVYGPRKEARWYGFLREKERDTAQERENIWRNRAIEAQERLESLAQKRIVAEHERDKALKFLSKACSERDSAIVKKEEVLSQLKAAEERVCELERELETRPQPHVYPAGSVRVRYKP